MGARQTAQGRPELARVPLERALAIREATAADPRELATIRFDLARALWSDHRERRRAVELAEQARVAYGPLDGALAEEERRTVGPGSPAITCDPRRKPTLEVSWVTISRPPIGKTSGASAVTTIQARSGGSPRIGRVVAMAEEAKDVGPWAMDCSC